MSRTQELLRSIPPTTQLVMGTCIILHGAQLLLDLELNFFTMCPRLVIFSHQYYRIFTSALFHVNLMHLGFNMMSTFAISTLLEKRLGTLRQMISILWAILLTSLLYLTIAWLANVIFSYSKWMNQHSVGFSGIIFHMSVLECNIAPNSSRSFFGFFAVPSYIYPWVLLVGLQFFMPNLSFLGHLVGILTGTLQSYGYLECLMPTPEFLMAVESSRMLQPLASILMPTTTEGGRALGRPQSTTSIAATCYTGVNWIRSLLAPIWVYVFGHGSRLNGNITLGRFWGNESAAADETAMSSLLLTPVEEEEDWVGLPEINSTENDVTSTLV